jgi:hypothetical protein
MRFTRRDLMRAFRSVALVQTTPLLEESFRKREFNAAGFCV